MTYRIAEAAELARLPATSIRYYEARGVLPDPDREPSGYRSYGEHDLERLRFVGQARHLGLPVEVLRELVAAWDAGHCGRLASTLRRSADGHLADLHRQVGELTTAIRRVSDARRSLAEIGHDGPCDERCADAQLVPASSITAAAGAGDDGRGTGDDGRAVGEEVVVPSSGLPLMDDPRTQAVIGTLSCELPVDQMHRRADEWRRLLGKAASAAPTDDGHRFAFELDPSIAAEVTALAAAEHACCRPFTFTLRITADALELHVAAPGQAASLLGELAATTGSVGDSRPA